MDDLRIEDLMVLCRSTGVHRKDLQERTASVFIRMYRVKTGATRVLIRITIVLLGRERADLRIAPYLA
jgi:hypothetical protein